MKRYVPSSDSRRPDYIVTLNDDEIPPKAVHCTCPGYMFRNKCRHLKIAEEGWQTLPEVPPFEVREEPEDEPEDKEW